VVFKTDLPRPPYINGFTSHHEATTLDKMDLVLYESDLARARASFFRRRLENRWQDETRDIATRGSPIFMQTPSAEPNRL
jgi:hypothetical protein